MAKKTTTAGPLIPNVGPAVPKPVAPPRIWPMWRDAAMMARIAEWMAAGASEVAASLCEGLSDKTVSTWLSRWRAAVMAADEASEAKPPPEVTEFVAAVSPIARARGEWLARTEGEAGAGMQGAQWLLERRFQDVYGKKQEVTFGDSGAAEVAGLLDRIAEVRSASES